MNWAIFYSPKDQQDQFPPTHISPLAISMFCLRLTRWKMRWAHATEVVMERFDMGLLASMKGTRQSEVDWSHLYWLPSQHKVISEVVDKFGTEKTIDSAEGARKSRGCQY